MSKRAKEAALKAYPISTPPSYLDGHDLLRQEAFIRGYEQGEKETLDRVCEWLEKNITYMHPRKQRRVGIVNCFRLKEAILKEE